MAKFVEGHAAGIEVPTGKRDIQDILAIHA